ncbi:MAG: bifunctional UDP-N-acetylglucosamine diphosphorylase/glucosamine-1-phosphate N-acetyltransferase GlmU [Anaerolineae bacterium]|nr:bifunctional UDP-N-acetylglucosamine diphosphorylase/glucosamine-1-phosphate N-acetyltransferase GlmU [Anaerolineae bacterium]
MNLAVVILAAGQGTRMKSSLPKVLHPLAGQPLVSYSLNTARSLATHPPVLVVGRGSEAVRTAVGASAIFVEQAERLGTGHAVLQAREALRGKTDLVAVIYADMPLLTADSVQRLVDRQTSNTGPLTILVLVSDNPRGFGRVIRDTTGAVREVVEEAVATPEQMAVNELNAGVYCFDADWLWSNIDKIPLSMPKGEYYLTDMVGMSARDGRRVEGVITTDDSLAIGVNTLVHLAEAEQALRRRINTHWMTEGVTIVDPATTYIEPSVTIGSDTTIWPNTHLRGHTTVGSACQIGPNSVVSDCTIADQCRVLASVLEHAVMQKGANIGPFSHLRKGAELGENAHVGNFGELKNAKLGSGVRMGHFGYLGDAEVATKVNIGAGTITCNYDGVQKHRTVIEEGAFIGSDTMLVAPVRIGRGAKTGAGSVVTHDVPDGSVAYGVPARIQERKDQQDDQD